MKMQISLIDNENMVNHLGDVPSEVSYGKMKIRGNTSSSQTYPKKQYLIKLLTEDEEPNIVGMLGMTASDTWILNGTQLDKSYLRNYISMNTAGEISAYTPDIRFCEMVLKRVISMNIWACTDCMRKSNEVRDVLNWIKIRDISCSGTAWIRRSSHAGLVD